MTKGLHSLLTSPTLTAIPRPHIPLSWRLRLGFKRFVVIAFVSAIPILLILTIGLHGWAEDTLPGSLLYWLHDYIYLPIKGEVHTRHAPVIFLFWFFILVLSTLAFASWVSTMSFIKGPQILALRWLITKPGTRTIVPAVSSLFPPFMSFLTYQVAEYEWEQSLLELYKQFNAPPERKAAFHTRAIDQLMVMLKLKRHFPSAYKELRTVEQWYLTLIAISTHGRAQAHHMRSIAWMAKTFPFFGDLETDKPAASRLFSPDILATDVRDLAAILEASHPVPSEASLFQFNPQQHEIDALVQRVYGNVKARLQLLKDYIYEASNQISIYGEVRQPFRVTLEGLPFNMRSAGRLSILITAHISLRLQMPELLEDYQDTIDTLTMLNIIDIDDQIEHEINAMPFYHKILRRQQPHIGIVADPLKNVALVAAAFEDDKANVDSIPDVLLALEQAYLKRIVEWLVFTRDQLTDWETEKDLFDSKNAERYEEITHRLTLRQWSKFLGGTELQ